MTTRPAELAQRLWVSTIVFGLLAAILGVVILVWPGPTLIVAAVLFGVYLVTSGIALVLLAFTLPVAGGGHRILSFVSGAASIILGVLAFRHFDEGYAFLLLAIWIAIGFIFRGVGAGGQSSSVVYDRTFTALMRRWNHLDLAQYGRAVDLPSEPFQELWRHGGQSNTEVVEGANGR